MILLGFSFVDNGYVQSELNKAWAAEGGPVPGDEMIGKPLPPAQDPLTTTSTAEPQATVGDSPERPAS
jgi:hypothetical protein